MKRKLTVSESRYLVYSSLDYRPENWGEKEIEKEGRNEQEVTEAGANV